LRTGCYWRIKSIRKGLEKNNRCLSIRLHQGLANTQESLQRGKEINLESVGCIISPLFIVKSNMIEGEERVKHQDMEGQKHRDS